MKLLFMISASNTIAFGIAALITHDIEYMGGMWLCFFLANIPLEYWKHKNLQHAK